MTGKTHRAGGTAFALVAFEVMRYKGWLLPGVNDFIQLAMMYPLVSWGSIFPDLDHGVTSIPDKDPVSYGVNWVLRKAGSKHRSWQTHSILVTGGLCFLLYATVYLLNAIFGVQDNIGWAYLRLSSMGFIMGVTSHLFLDLLTTGGIHLIPGYKIRLVPRSKKFITGGLWEKIIFRLLIFIIVLITIKIFLGEIDDTFLHSILDKFISMFEKIKEVAK